MSLILITMAFGIVPAWRGSLAGVLLGAWIVAGAMSAAILFGSVELANVLPSIGLAILGYNTGLAMGFGLNYVLSSQPAKH